MTHTPLRPSRRSALAAIVLAALVPMASVADDAKPAAAPPKDPPKTAVAAKEFVLMTTSKGEILLELDREKAPISVANFVEYAKAGFYDGTIFHRVIPGFMIQGGGFTEDMKQKTTRPAIRNEWQNGLLNERGTIAMARLPQPDTATSQFFINVKDNPALDGNPQLAQPGYAVFGRVVEGMDVVDAIKAVRTTRMGPHEAVPVEAVVITKVALIDEADAKKRLDASKAAKGASAAGSDAAPPAQGAAAGNGKKSEDAGR